MNYFPDYTKYLTNNGLKCLQDFEDGDQLAVIDSNGEIYYTTNYDVVRMNTDSLVLTTDGHYQSLLGTKKQYFTSYYPVLKDDEPDYLTFNFGEDTIDILTKDIILFISLFLNTYFKEVNNVILYNGKGKKKLIYSVIKYLYSNYNLFFPYNRITNTYTCPETNIFLDNEQEELLIARNLNLFNKIHRIGKESNFIYSRCFSKVYFNSYRIANIYQVGLSLSGFKTRLYFNKEVNMFEVSFTNTPHFLDYNYELEEQTVIFKKPIEVNSIKLSKPGKIVISQNINKNTTISILNIS